MHWEQVTPEFEDLPESEIPVDLLQGLERLAADAVLRRARLRWRPHESMSKGFLTKDRLLELEGASNVEIAGALASYARHLYDQGECEARFEAQIRRDMPLPDQPERTFGEWRSITFYVHPPTPDGSTVMPHDLDDDDTDDDESDDDDSELDDEFELPTSRPPRPAQHRPPARMASRPSRPRNEESTFEQYASRASLMRTDPAVFAMAVVQQTHERTVDTLERILNTAFDRLDRTLEGQRSQSDFVHGALETITRGSGELASVGLDLFRAGLDHKAEATRATQDTEVDKDRNELMRDAVQQGSLLAQAVLMSNAAKRRSSPEPQPQPRTHASARRPDPHGSPVSAPPDDGDPILMRAKPVLDAMTPELVEQLRERTPNVAAVFDELKSRPLTGAWVTEVFARAWSNVGQAEAIMFASMLGPDLFDRVMALLNLLRADAKS